MEVTKLKAACRQSISGAWPPSLTTHSKSSLLQKAQKHQLRNEIMAQPSLCPKWSTEVVVVSSTIPLNPPHNLTQEMLPSSN